MTSLSVRSRAAAVLGACVAVCALSAPAALAADHAVNLTTSKTFSPAAVSVAVGDTVTWTWAGDRSHNVTANTGQADSFSSGNKTTGTFVKTFSIAGSFSYRCTLHSGMNGTVTVVAPGGTPDTTPPSAPTGLAATAGNATVTLDWADSAATDLGHYGVERRVGAGAWSAVGAPTLSALTDATVTNGTTYSYRVTAVDTTGNASTASAIVSATPAAAVPPPPPPPSGTDHPVTLTASKTFSPAAVDVAPGDTVTWTWAGVQHNVTADAGQADTFSSGNKTTGTFVKTFNIAGHFTYRCTLHSGMTGAVNVVAPGSGPDTTPPSAPGGLLSTSGDATVTLDWADSGATDFANYVINRRVGTGAWTLIGSPVVSDLTDTTVANGTTYEYSVTTVDLTGNVSAASTVTATPAAAVPPPPGTPADRHVAIANYLFGPQTITVNTGDAVTWDWSGSDVNHTVTATAGQSETFESHPGIADADIVDGPVGGFSHTFNTVGSFTYYCRVHTDMTGTVNVVAPPATPDTTPPSAPAAPVTTAADSSITVDWPDSGASDLSNYVVQRQAGAGAWTTVAQPVASVYVDGSVVNGTTYSYRVSAVDTTGNVSLASAIVSATPVALPVTQSNAGPVVRHVAIAGYAYAPATVTVNSGDTVEWDWTGSDVNHSVTTLGGLLESFDSHLGALVNAIVGPPAGGTYSHLFSQVGSFGYYCRVHPDMTGTVRVVASGAPDVQPADPPAAPKPAAPAQDVKPARAAKTYAVKIADFAFAPANLSIALGDVVKWSWTGTDTNHSVTSTAGQAESYESHPGLKISEVLKAPAGGSFSHAFTHEGTFTYFCRVHPGMTGKVTVGPAPVRVRIVSVKRGSGSLQVSYRLTKRSAVKAIVYKGAKRVVTKSVKGRSGANTLRIELPKSARRAALKVVLRGGPDGAAQAKLNVRAARR